MPIKNAFLLTLLALCISLVSSFDPALAKSKKSRYTIDPDKFICRKMRKATLSKLKSDLLKYCDLTKQYSLGFERTVQPIYVFCCEANPNSPAPKRADDDYEDEESDEE